MFYRPLGSTGMQVSALGFGTVKLGRNQGVKYPDAFVIPEDREARILLDIARDLGINLLDTAPAYGNSEERLGKLLKNDRKHWLICSKTGEEFINGESHFDFSPEHTRRSVERSMKRLNTDYIDMVLVHSNGNDLAIIQQQGVLAQLAELKQKGWIRAFGMSTKTVEGGLLAAAESDVVMVTYNMNERDEEPVIDYCQKHHKGILVKKAFASGHICTETISDKTTTNVDAVEQSLAMIFAHAGVSSAIVGTINPQHLRDNVAKLLAAACA